MCQVFWLCVVWDWDGHSINVQGHYEECGLGPGKEIYRETFLDTFRSNLTSNLLKPNKAE